MTNPEKPSFDDRDPMLAEPSAEDIQSLCESVTNYFEGYINTAYREAKISLVDGYSVTITEGHAMQFDGNGLGPLANDVADQIANTDDNVNNLFPNSELRDANNRLTLQVDMPDGSFIAATSNIDIECGDTGMIYFDKDASEGEKDELFYDTDGYDGFAVSEDQVSRINQIVKAARQRMFNPEIELKSDAAVRVIGAIKFLTGTSNYLGFISGNQPQVLQAQTIEEMQANLTNCLTISPKVMRMDAYGTELIDDYGQPLPHSWIHAHVTQGENGESRIEFLLRTGDLTHDEKPESQTDIIEYSLDLTGTMRTMAMPNGDIMEWVKTRDNFTKEKADGFHRATLADLYVCKGIIEAMKQKHTVPDRWQ